MEKIALEQDNIFVLAEIAQSYEGDKSVLASVVRGLSAAGANGAMFQVVYAEELAVSDYEYYGLFESLEMRDEDWEETVNLVKENSLLAIGEVFGRRSFDLMIRLGIDGVKIQVSDINNEPFLAYVGSFSIPVLLAIGGASSSEIGKAIQLLSSKEKHLTLMHGYQDGPTKVSDTHFNKIKAIAQQYNLPVGYSDHVAGSVGDDNKVLNPLAMSFPLLAIGAGATLIEKHVMLDREKVWEDFESALSVDEFSDFVALIRQVETSLGSKSVERNETEIAYRRAIKAIVARTDLKVGTALSINDLAFKRPKPTQDAIKNTELVIGRKLKFDVKADEAITPDMLV
jgi:N,N'-diacetyllegionaminate synthase